jgi:calcineurin-like phosphoesterase
MNVNKNSIYSSWGVGSRIVKVGDKSIRITNLIGKSITMHKIETDSPFIKFTEFLEHCEPTDYHIVDFHAEATAEKKAFFLTFVGQVNAILGTHTHVQTNDAIIVNGTAFITDAGMTGATNGVIGADPDTILDMYNGRAERFILSPAKGKYQFNAVVVELDDKNNETKKITPINILEP